MTNVEHEKKMSDLEEKFLARLSDKDEIIREQKEQLREYRTALEGVKWLWKKIAESSDMQI